mmetsp:Transcript_44181/g.66610  ORF Transcript_44181/g.66610 Transcript_44181/m.66610 type:complete len:104 (-) Transcript_44181:904-1215(-)
MRVEHLPVTARARALELVADVAEITTQPTFVAPQEERAADALHGNAGRLVAHRHLLQAGALRDDMKIAGIRRSAALRRQQQLRHRIFGVLHVLRRQLPLQSAW